MAEDNQEKGIPSLHGASSKAIRQWWQSLDDNRGVRARLRRAESPDDALLTDSLSYFLQKMPDRWREEKHLYVSAMVAALLSHVKSIDTPKHFVTQLATGEGDRATMSELRFQQLLKSREPEEFFHRVLQAIRLLKGTVNIISLTEGILQWYDEYLYGPDSNPMNRLSVRWAQDYYKTIK